MTGKVRILALAVTLIGFTITDQARTQKPQQLSRGELRRLTTNASSPADYQKLAAYFRGQEQYYRVKADAEMHEYAECVRNVTMAPKFPTRADQCDRLYEYYSAKASHLAKLAARYDELLVRNGFKPVGNVQLVSVTQLREHPLTQVGTSALVPKAKAADEKQ